MKLIEYARIDGFIIAKEYDSDTEQFKGFVVCDINMERYAEQMFTNACNAIEWTNSNFKEL